MGHKRNSAKPCADSLKRGLDCGSGLSLEAGCWPPYPRNQRLELVRRGWRPTDGLEGRGARTDNHKDFVLVTAAV
jgi:hypothetical protein